MIIASRHSIKQDLLAYGEIHLAQMIDNLSDEDLNTIGKLAVKYMPKGGYVSKTIVYGAIEFFEGVEREPLRKKRDLSIYRNDTFKDTENIISRMHNKEKSEFMSTIKIQRSTNFFDRTKNYKILIDGQLVWVPNDENNGGGSFEVHARQHTIIAKGNWTSSREISFNINANETITFEVGVFKLLKYMHLYCILLLFSSSIQSGAYLKYFGILCLPPLLIYLYYLTFGRHNYFIIKEK